MSGGMARTVLGVPRQAAPWLVYLAILALQPLFGPEEGGLKWLHVALAAAVFLPVYGWTHRVIGHRPFLWRAGVPGGLVGVALMTALGVGYGFLNGGAAVFFIYAAVAAGALRPRRPAITVLGAVMAATVIAFFVSPVPLPERLFSFVPAFVFGPALGMITISQADKRVTDAKLRMAQEQVENLATIAERERIARDLHDLLGHTFSTITLKAELAARLAAADPARAEREMRDVEQLSRQALAEVRAAVRGYRGSGIAGELVNAKLALEAAGAAFDYFVEPLPLRPAVEAVLAAALREASTNVIRHAGAGRCQVTLADDGAFVLLTVVDDGVGLDAAGAHAAGTGLSAMRERVRALRGAVTLAPAGVKPRAGARLEVRIPRQAALLHEAAAAPLPARLAEA